MLHQPKYATAIRTKILHTKATDLCARNCPGMLTNRLVCICLDLVYMQNCMHNYHCMCMITKYKHNYVFLSAKERKKRSSGGGGGWGVVYIQLNSVSMYIHSVFIQTQTVIMDFRVNCAKNMLCKHAPAQLHRHAYIC